MSDQDQILHCSYFIEPIAGLFYVRRIRNILLVSGGYIG